MSKCTATRRAVLAAVAATAVSPLRSFAQSPQKMLRVGYAGFQPPDSPAYRAFQGRMAELGYDVGRNFTFDFLRVASVDEFAAAYRELAARGCDILIASGNEFALRAARAAAAGHIPIVFFALDFDPFEKGYVASLAKPGGNATGIFVQQIELAEKRVELARAVLPTARALGLLWDAASRDQATAASAIASNFGFEPRLIEAGGEPPDYAAAVAPMADVPGALLLIPASPRFYRDRVVLFDLTLRRHIPAVGAFPEQAEAGALLTYGVNLSTLLRDIAPYVDRIAKGARPADIPIEQPTRFHMTLNVKAAKALNLEVPSSLLARADDVIE